MTNSKRHRTGNSKKKLVWKNTSKKNYWKFEDRKPHVNSENKNLNEEYDNINGPLYAASIVLPKRPRKPTKPQEKSVDYEAKIEIFKQKMAEYPNKLKEYEKWMASHSDDVRQYHLYKQLIFERKRQNRRPRCLRMPVYVEELH